MTPMGIFFLFLLFALPAEAQWWKVQTSGLDTNLRGVSVGYASNASPPQIVWASGSNGVILRSTDLGKTWKRLHVSGGDSLDFRGIVGFSSETAYVMSSGEGEKSRIYKTTDGGETWKLQYTGNRKGVFLDSIACLSEAHCFTLGDPLDGKFLLLTTTDGEHWNALPNDKMPAALPGEGAFAASNTCLALYGEDIFFGTGGPAARVFHSTDSGRAWTVSETPIAHGNTSSGIFSIAHGQGKTAVVVGGDYQDPARGERVAAYSEDHGKTWQLSAKQPSGYRSSVAPLHGANFFTVGPTGEEFSDDRGISWKRTDSLTLNALAIYDDEYGWAVGPNGTIAVFVSLLHPVF